MWKYRYSDITPSQLSIIGGELPQAWWADPRSCCFRP